MQNRILIVGIGNEFMGDDALGPATIARFASDYDFTPAVELKDLGLGGIRLLDYLSGRDAVLIIDVLDIAGRAPGEVIRFSKAELVSGPPGARLSPHELSLKETLLLADKLGAGAAGVVLFGIVGKTFDMGSGLSDELRAALPALDAAVAAELGRFGVTMRLKRPPGSEPLK
jgi:hydrogenase maturation protease